MRNSNSREKPSTATSTSTYAQNRLMKTQLPPKSNTKQTLNSTQYRLPTNTPSIKYNQSSKTSNSSDHNLPKQQINFDIQKNMTESKIITAKESLQLLKKKMNRTGMSREKPSNTPQSSQNIQPMQKTAFGPDSMKKIKSDSSKNIQNYEPVPNKYPQSSKNFQQQQDYNNKNSYEPQSYKPQQKKPIQQEKPILKKTTSVQETYQNQLEQVPIVRKQTFEEMLERELRKEQNMKSGTGNSFGRNQPKMEIPEQDEQGELYECSKGCGRQFNANVLAKHEKICQKVFQSKRKVFNTAAQRQVQNQGGFQKPPAPMNSFNQTRKPVQKKSKIPKWKLESAQLRAGLKATKNTPLTPEQEALTNMQKDSLVPCEFCGRKFNQKAAIRHIPVCGNKAKQMPRPSNPKKK